jgi:hypothetical protein
MNMKIEKKIVAAFGAPYSICSGSLMNERVVIAGSETIGGAFTLYSGPGNDPAQIVEGMGGVMAILILDPTPVPALLTAEGLHTNFISRDAGISVYRAEKGLHGPWRRHRIVDLPFIHRVALVTAHGKKNVLAATLCGKKDAVDDWSSPGAVYAVQIEGGTTESQPEKKVIIDGITKNHGMHVLKRDGRETVYVSGEEGLFAIRVPQGTEGWDVEKMMDQPISEFSLYDLDDDGEREIVAIQPFHGDTLCIYKRDGSGWVRVYETGIEAGHGIWAGSIGGRNGIVLGSRAGKRDFCLYTIEDCRRWMVQKTVIDEGTGTTQLDVRRERNRDVIAATNNYLNEVAVYEVTA